MSGSNSFWGYGSTRGNGGSESDDGCEVDGSFIILPTKKSSDAFPSVRESSGYSGSAQELNLNVSHQAGHESVFVPRSDVVVEPEPVSVSSVSSLLASQQVSSGDGTESGRNSGRLSIAEAGNTATGTDHSIISNISCCSSDSAYSIEDANAKVLQLLEENEKLKVFVRELNEKQKRFFENCKLLEDVLEKSKADTKEQERKYERSRSVIETSLEASENSAELRQLERMVEEKDALLQDASNQNQELKELLRKLGNELNETKLTLVSMGDNSSLQNERDLLFTAFEESKLTISKLTERHEADEEELKKVHEAVNLLRIQLDQAQASFKEQSEINSNLNVACEMGENELRLLKEQHQKAIQEFDKNIASKDAEISRLKGSLETLELESRQKIASMKADLEDKEVFRIQMEEYKSNFEYEQKDRLDMKAKLAQVTDEFAKVQEELEKKIGELDELRSRHRTLATEHINSGDASQTDTRNSSDNISAGAVGGATQGSPFCSISLHTSGTGNLPVQDVNCCPLCQKTFTKQIYLTTHAANCDGTFRPEGEPKKLFKFP